MPPCTEDGRDGGTPATAPGHALHPSGGSGSGIRQRHLQWLSRPLLYNICGLLQSAATELSRLTLTGPGVDGHPGEWDRSHVCKAGVCSSVKEVTIQP